MSGSIVIGYDGSDEAGHAIEVAAEYDADLVVVGRRGVPRLAAVVLGSVSNDTVRKARRPVLHVPSRTIDACHSTDEFLASEPQASKPVAGEDLSPRLAER